MLNELNALCLSFCKFLGFFSFCPGFKENFIAKIVRVALALVMSNLMPIKITLFSNTNFDLLLELLKHVFLGVVAGLIVQIILSSFAILANVLDSILGFSQNIFFNPNRESSNLVSIILVQASLTILWCSPLIYKLLGFVINFSSLQSNLCYQSFNSLLLGFTLGLPLLIIMLILYVIMGFFNRLVTSIPVFILLTPIQLIFGLTLMLVHLSGLIATLYGKILIA